MPISKIETNQRKIDPSGQKVVVFTALENDLRFQLDMSSLDSIAYQLVGLEKKPNFSRYPEIRYMNIAGGNYTLELKGYKKGEITSQSSLKVSIEHELTEVWWFVPALVAYGLLIIGAIVYFSQLNSFRNKLKVQQLRNTLAADLHDEVGATLSSIALSSNLINRKLTDRPEIKNMLSQIKKDAEDTVQTIRDTVWTINPDNDSMEKLIEKMRAFAYQIFAAKEIEFEFENAVDSYPDISMERRRNAYLIVREALNNIAKHSNASLAWLKIRNLEDEIEILVKDNGRGFDQNTSEGNGLKNFKKRANDAFMDLDFKTEINQGTTLTLKIPYL